MQKDKIRDMVRSILPSKNREAAGKAKRMVKRRVRRCVRVDVRLHETEDRDLWREAEIDVYWRRLGDKLNHFIRWCHALTRGMDREDALSLVRAFLPHNVIGDHAYTHWKVQAGDRPFTNATWREARRRRVQSTFDRMVHVINRAMEIDPDFAGNLNRLIKERQQPDQPRRLLLGRHDVEAFVRRILFVGCDFDEIVRNGWPCGHCMEKKCVIEVLEQVEREYAPKRGLAL